MRQVARFAAWAVGAPVAPAAGAPVAYRTGEKKLRQVMSILWTITCVALASTHSSVSGISGTFRGSVRPLLLPVQEITVTTSNAKKGGVVTLRGAVNAKDVFWVEWHDDSYSIRVGPEIDKAMKRVRVRLVTFVFDELHDIGRATVEVPMLGRLGLTLRRVPL